ncbi:hypothetical protein [Cytobacillus firmus]|uniref:hypothetical protein n=1 Tax=Cytobacillus firmus TaxID=1399 RepID=UPI001C8E1DED|nr:hypothetical protein [Cytobacillus firmus]MBX9975737.1 hypothetical protein [Cytobacillus firmus]
MGIQTQLLGIGKNDEIVTVIGQVDISEDGKMAHLAFENKSPLPHSGPDLKLVSLTLNIGSLMEADARILDIKPASWRLSVSKDMKESKLQMILQPEQPELGLAQNETLGITLLNMEKNGRFKEEDFIGNGSDQKLQVIASFNRQNSGEPISIEGYFFKAPYLKQQHDEANYLQPSVTITSLAPDITTTPAPNVTTTPAPNVTTTPLPGVTAGLREAKSLLYAADADTIPPSNEPGKNNPANTNGEAFSILKMVFKAMGNSLLTRNPNDSGFNFKLCLFGLANLEVRSSFSFHLPIINKLCAELIKGVKEEE